MGYLLRQSPGDVGNDAPGQRLDLTVAEAKDRVALLPQVEVSGEAVALEFALAGGAADQVGREQR